MRLDENFELTSDEYSWTLTYTKEGEVNPATGRPKQTVQRTYHSNLAQALKGYVDNSLKPAQTVEEMLAKLTELEQRIDTIRRGEL